MNNTNSGNNKLQSLLPESTKGKIIYLAIIILTFSLGMFFAESENPDKLLESVHSERDHATSDWTCSMHPQIILPEEGKCPICYMDLIPLERNSNDGLNPNQIKLSANARQLAQIETTEVVRGNASRSIHLMGKVSYDETSLASITARVKGRLDTLFVDYTGSEVNKGDKLVSIYSPELYSAQEELLNSIQAINNTEESDSKILKVTSVSNAEAAREKLRLLGLSNGQINNLEKNNKVSSNLTLLAEQDGIVIERNADEGSYVEVGTEIYKIANLTKLWATFEAYESDLPWLTVGQSISFRSNSMPSETIQSKITFIDPILDATTRTVKIRADFDNITGKFKPDMFVSGSIKSKIGNSDELLIPVTAPLLTGKRAIVYIEKLSSDDIIYEGREVLLGPKTNDFYIVREGLSAGERVVTHGAFKIDSELQIQAKLSMMSAPTVEIIQEESKHNRLVNKETILEITSEAVNALSPLFDAYLKLQMALAEDDFPTALDANEQIHKSNNKIDMDLFTGESHKIWMGYSNEISKFTHLGKSSENISSLRDHFFHLSKAFIQLQETFGHNDGRTYYLTYCPMARDHTGAYWLQEIDTVYNSFYGDLMLHCGEIKTALPAGIKRKE